ncbi:MAG: FAD-dependent oxidoreductase, partial [Actinomycetota bacterium]
SYAAVIGGGFIGLEVASVLAAMGINTTIIHRRDHLMEKFDHPDISSYFERYFAGRGINVIYEDEVSEIKGKEWVEGVATKSGRSLSCDMVLAGIGVVPDTDYLKDSGIELENGVVTDEFLMTSDPDVFAAGDIANYHDPVYGRQRRTEHWDNAIRQGEAVARNMVGGREPYVRTSFFYSTVFNITYECYGDMREYEKKVVRGSFDENSCTVFYLKDDTVQGAFIFNRPASERRLISDLIAEQRLLSLEVQSLEDERIPLEVVLAH